MTRQLHCSKANRNIQILNGDLQRREPLSWRIIRATSRALMVWSSMLTGIDTITSEIPIAPLFFRKYMYTCINDDNHALRRPHRNLLVWRKFSTLTEKNFKMPTLSGRFVTLIRFRLCMTLDVGGTFNPKSTKQTL